MRDMIECLTVKRDSNVILKKAVGKVNEQSVTVSLVGKYENDVDVNPHVYRVIVNSPDRYNISSKWVQLRFVADREFNKLRRKYKLKGVDI